MKFTDKDLLRIGKPHHAAVQPGSVVIVSRPRTDLWQHTRYGFQQRQRAAFTGRQLLSANRAPAG